MMFVHASAIASLRSSISSTENRMRLPTAAAAKRATATHSARAGMRSSTTPRVWTSGSGAFIVIPELSSDKGLHCTLFVIEDSENLDESRNVEDLLDLRIRADQVHRSAMLAYAFEAADQHTQSGTVDVANFLEVDDQVVMTLIDQLRNRILDFGGRVDVDLSCEIDDVGISFRFADVDLDIHNLSCSMAA